MVTLRSRALLPALILLFGCSSSAFEVGEGDAGNDTQGDGSSGGDSAIDSGSKTDSSALDSSAVDSSTTLDTAAQPDSTPTLDAKPDTVGCVPGTTTPCECNGVRTCGADGTYGMCHDICLPSPSRFLCAYGKGGCTEKTCFDSNNCVAKCGCAAAPGSKCMLTDPCWGYVCNDYVCPS